jgi:hypothetical protein
MQMSIVMEEHSMVSIPYYGWPYAAFLVFCIMLAALL